jgi:hypothetical protein
MELTRDQKKVLEIFRAHDIEKGEYLATQTLERERQKLTKTIQKNWDTIMRGLITSGYLTRDPLGYGLTETGYYHLHHDDES